MDASATDVLTRMAAAYAGCTSYQDEGVVTTTFFSPSKRTQRRPFSTRFLRPHGFLFEFRSRRGEDDWDQYVVWLENGRPRTWWSIRPDPEEIESLGRAIAGATGVSGGSAHRVPRLLMPQLQGNCQAPIHAPATMISVPEATALGCFVVERPRVRDDTEQLWIDSSSFLIRRVVEPRHALRPPQPDVIERLIESHPERATDIAKRFSQQPERESVEVESVTTYDGTVDVQVLPSELVFVAPTG